MSDLTNRLLDDASIFRFNGDGFFAHEIVDEIQLLESALKQATDDLQCILDYLDKHKDGHTISWDDVANDIGDDIRATIQKCQSAITRS